MLLVMLYGDNDHYHKNNKKADEAQEYHAFDCESGSGRTKQFLNLEGA